MGELLRDKAGPIGLEPGITVHATDVGQWLQKKPSARGLADRLMDGQRELLGPPTEMTTSPAQFERRGENGGASM
ncbi:hypothetical protein ACFYWO_01210 [Streptomyces sp. NPDC002932]|uniref:hypothetical protein n=1 Tax=Streptomyces sp. NPDC002932 TaxID=3364672 RepID=UPI00367CB9ED